VEKDRLKINRISAVTLFVKDMYKSCEFYSRIPGFRLVCGGSSVNFTSFEISEEKQMYLNLELKTENKNRDFGRIIFYTDNVDELYLHLSSDQDFAKLATFENEPTTANWGERFFHLRDPDHYQLSFATPIISKEKSLGDHN